MARVVVRNRDKSNTDSPYLDAKCMKKGMVVEILPDGASLGAVGDQYDGWTVVEFPGVSVDSLRALVASEPGDPRVNRMLQRRSHLFDLDAHVAGGRRPLAMRDVQRLKKPVTPLSDPNVL